MIKRLLTIGAIGISAFASAQSVPNGGMETWVDQTLYEDPAQWGTLNILTLFGGPATVTKSTTVHSGTYAAKLEIAEGDFDGDGNNDTVPAAMFLGSIDFMSGTSVDGAAFTSRPDSLIGWYKYAPQGGDFFVAEVILSKWNSGTGERDEIATAAYVGTAAMANYTRVATGLTYNTADTPDTLSIVISTGSTTVTPGTTLWVDDLSFVTNSSTSAPELTTVTELQSYPNPANQSMTVIAPKNTTIQVYNALGMHMDTIKANASEKVTLQTAGYRNGVYFLKTESGELQRFVVQH